MSILGGGYSQVSVKVVGFTVRRSAVTHVAEGLFNSRYRLDTLLGNSQADQNRRGKEKRP
jgi:hypothetical protein